MENVVIYARFSSHNQNEQSIEGQLKECHQFAARNNYNIIEEYIDRAISGTSENRPSFQRMIEDSKDKRFSYVLVYQLDRFARDRYASAKYKHILKKNGVRVLSAKENITDDASGVMMESVFEGMAEYYSRELSQKVRRGMSISASKCKFLGGKRTFGYSVDEEKNFIINEYEASWVKKIFEMYSSGRGSEAILLALNENNVQNVDRQFNIDSIRRIIENRKYIGEYKFKGEIVKNGIPAIVDEELFEKANSVKIDLAKHYRCIGTPNFYALSSKLTCACCNNKIIGHTGTSHTKAKFHYYKCVGNEAKHICSLPALRQDELENSVTQTIFKILSDKDIDEIVDNTLKEFEDEKYSNRLNEIDNELVDVDSQITNLTNLLARNRSVDIILDKIDSLSSRKAELEEEKYKISRSMTKIDRDSLVERLKAIRDYNITDKKALEAFADAFIERIIVYENKKIAVILSLDNSFSISTNDGFVWSHMVQPMRITFLVI